MASDTVLEVKDLSMTYQIRQGEVKAVQDVSFRLGRGQSLGLVGESGCGKSSVANCLMGLLPDNARVSNGQVILGGEDLLALPEETLRLFRWNRIAMVFQAAMNVLDPVYRVGHQIMEAIEAHTQPGAIRNRASGWRSPTGLTARTPGRPADDDARQKVAELFRKVGLDPRLMDRYPHEFSGGMRQRAVIAMALSCDPDVIIADEPTTALDVIMQDRILRELKAIQADTDLAVIYISHDIAVIAEVTDVVAVMYAGRLVELGSTAEVLTSPMHHYTVALTSSFPSLLGDKRPLTVLGGEPPDLLSPQPGCPFAPRCRAATEVCKAEPPPRVSRGDHWATCWHPESEGGMLDGVRQDLPDPDRRPAQ